MKRLIVLVAAIIALGVAASALAPSPVACAELGLHGLRAVADTRDTRFLGKVRDFTTKCRAPEAALKYRNTPWVDWSNYWGAGDESSRAPGIFTAFERIPGLGRLGPDHRGIDGALLDLEYQRMELLKFNLFDNYTYRDYVNGRDGVPGRSVKIWPEMRLPASDPHYQEVGGAGKQVCSGELVRYRTLTGICNDVFNPLMGSTSTDFARNVQFEETFPDLSDDQIVRNRHGDRIGLMKPDPQVVSRELLTRAQSDPARCNEGQGVRGDSMAACDYIKAPFFNVLAAFWIQFMTNDWFSHLEEGHNAAALEPMGCAAKREGGAERPLTPEEVAALGCRPDDRIDGSLYSRQDAPPTFTYTDPATHQQKTVLARSPKTTANEVTAWWDASQIYGYDDVSARRVKRDPRDPAKLLMVHVGDRSWPGDRYGYLPVLQPTDPMNPQWAGQEAVAFPDNWSAGISFLHNLFVREHNIFVEEFRKQAARTPEDDSGLRDPAHPDRVIRYIDVTPDELYQVARLVVAAEIAKIHTTEWTTQLLYDEVLYQAMNANWHGLLKDKPLLSHAVSGLAMNTLRGNSNEDVQTQWYSIFASGTGIVGFGSHRYADHGALDWVLPQKDLWSVANPVDLNAGVNHFGSPFNFPEEFITVYRLHALVPDMIDFREVSRPNVIEREIPVLDVFRGKATQAIEQGGLANWGLSMGRQRLGALTLQNYPQFLQNVPMPRLASSTGKIDVAALDILRDRERGVPRFNEFRRQYGLKTLTGFDDFVDQHLAPDSPERRRQEELVAKLREVYGQHTCDASKVITRAQLDDAGKPINDCLGHPDGSLVDNVEDLDVVVGFLAESTRPHGFAISETQFTVFIINASRRLFSDRFFTSSFRPEFYSRFGLDWVINNGPTVMMETGRPNGHEEVVSPMKRVMLRAMPELAPELSHVVNAFDPWGRDRGDYYSVDWKPRSDAAGDPAFGEGE